MIELKKKFNLIIEVSILAQLHFDFFIGNTWLVKIKSRTSNSKSLTNGLHQLQHINISRVSLKSIISINSSQLLAH